MTARMRGSTMRAWQRGCRAGQMRDPRRRARERLSPVHVPSSTGPGRAANAESRGRREQRGGRGGKEGGGQAPPLHRAGRHRWHRLPAGAPRPEQLRAGRRPSARPARTCPVPGTRRYETRTGRAADKERGSVPARFCPPAGGGSRSRGAQCGLVPAAAAARRRPCPAQPCPAQPCPAAAAPPRPPTGPPCPTRAGPASSPRWQ